MKKSWIFVLLALVLALLAYANYCAGDKAACFTKDGFTVIASSSDSKIKEIFSDWKKEDAESVEAGNADAFMIVARGKITVFLTKGFKDPEDGFIVRGFNISYKASSSNIKDALFEYLFKQRAERLQKEQKKRERQQILELDRNNLREI